MERTFYGDVALHKLLSRLQTEHQRYRAAVHYIPVGEARLQEDLRKYLCLRCAGFLERVTYVAVTRYLEDNSSGPIQEFAKSHFVRSPNLNPDSLIKLLGRFGGDMQARIELFLTEPRRAALNDLAALRNPIAHGQDAGGAKLDPDRYIRLCEDVYQWYLSKFLSSAAEGVQLGVGSKQASPNPHKSP